MKIRIGAVEHVSTLDCERREVGVSGEIRRSAQRLELLAQVLKMSLCRSCDVNVGQRQPLLDA